MAGTERVVVGSQALMNEICDEERFAKVVAASLDQVRNGVHDGLFTAYGPEEKNWGEQVLARLCFNVSAETIPQESHIEC